MLHKMTRVGLIESHGVLWERVMDNDVVPFVGTKPTSSELTIRAERLNATLEAAINYAAIVVEDTYAHLDIPPNFADTELDALRHAAKCLHALLLAHADIIGKPGTTPAA